MPLQQIIDTFCRNSGFDPDNQRPLIVKIINAAAKEIYEFDDLPGCLMEVTVKVPANNVIALPYFIGELRAMREYFNYNKVILKEMAPRYSYQPWAEVWSNWRVLSKSPIVTSVVNAILPITFSIGTPETSALNITIEGRTLTASRVTETVTIEAGEINTQANKNFIEIYSITKTAVNDNDILVCGADENNLPIQLAVIPNNRLNSLYTIVDVSRLPYGGDAGTDLKYIDVLYKQPLNQLLNDGDTFPCEGFDDCIAYKALELDAAIKEGGTEIALGWYRKCEQIMNQRTAHTNGATQKQIVFAPNQYLGMYPRGGIRGSVYRRYGIVGS